MSAETIARALGGDGRPVPEADSTRRARTLRQLRKVLEPDSYYRHSIAVGLPWQRIAISGVSNRIMALAAYIEIERKLPTLPRELEAFRDDIRQLAHLP